jgi:hypothetical protein
LHDGLPGTALLLAALSTADPSLARAAVRHWECAAALLGRAAPDGIHRGPGALATSLIIGAGCLPCHLEPSTVDDAVAWLSGRAQVLARRQETRSKDGTPGAPWAIYDAIKGLTGIGRVLLAAHENGHARAATPGLNAALTTLTRMINAPARPLPGWWVPARDHRLHTAHPIPASGAATTGLAHGIAGPLALLAAALTNGNAVRRQREAIRTAASWLLTWRDPDGGWPSHIPGDALARGPGSGAVVLGGRRDAWCYGSAGIGNALVLAGQALRDSALQREGHAALARLTTLPPARWDTTGPGLCHGTAGVLAAAHRHGHETLARTAATATIALSSSLDRPGPPNDPGLLNGSAGAALALADHAGLLPRPTPTPWSALFLLC